MKHAPNVTPYDVLPDAVAADGGPDIRSERSEPQRDHPCLLVTAELLGEIAEKCRRHPWAHRNLRSMERLAQRWQPPELARFKIERKGFTWYGLTRRQTIEELWQAALVCKLTGSQEVRDKVLTYLRRIADPDFGYPTTRWATDSTAYVHEGEFFTFYPAVYDLMYDDLSRDDHASIAATLQLYLRTCEAWHDGGTGNWSVTANTGAILSSLVLRDMAMLDHFLNTGSGFVDQLSKGVMGDGWWLEGASNYGYLVSRYFGYAAEACHNHGIDLYRLRVPSRPGHLSHDDWPNGWMGMNFDGWGPPGAADRGLKDLHDGPIPMMDQSGCVVANSDSHKLAPGDLYELAYYRYRDPAYAWILARTDRMAWQSLVWGVPELPDAADPRAGSAHADNVGIAALRSQAPGREAQAIRSRRTSSGGSMAAGTATSTAPRCSPCHGTEPSSSRLWRAGSDTRVRCTRHGCSRRSATTWWWWTAFSRSRCPRSNSCSTRVRHCRRASWRHAPAGRRRSRGTCGTPATSIRTTWRR